MSTIKYVLFRIYRIFLFVVGYMRLKFNKKPPSIYFVIGSGRCGSSLLNKILKSSDELTVFPGEANYLWHPVLYHKKPDHIPPIIENPDKYTKTTINRWKPINSINLKYVFYGFSLVQGANKPLVVKSAMISHMVPFIRTLFPNAKFIHLYRNGISVTSSLIRKEHKRYPEYLPDEFEKLCAAYWNNCILTIESQKNNLNDIFLEVSYEDLVKKPKETMNKLCGYLSINSGSITYDFAKIEDKNYKIGDYRDDKWDHIKPFIQEAMYLKGYY